MVAVVGPGACLGRFPGPFQMGYQEACWQRGWLSRGHRVFAHLSSFSYLPHHCKCTPGHHLLDSTAAVQGRRGDRKQSEKEKGRMKKLKRIFAVLALLSAVLLISYLAFTGGQV